MNNPVIAGASSELKASRCLIRLASLSLGSSISLQPVSLMTSFYDDDGGGDGDDVTLNENERSCSGAENCRRNGS